MMRSQHIGSVSKNVIEEEGFEGWWSPVERVLGCLQWDTHDIFLVNTIPWDWAPGGRVDNIIKHTEPLQKHRVRNFFKEVSILSSVVSESLNPHTVPPHPSTQPHEPVPVILMSRYPDNIYIMLLNIAEGLVPIVKTFATTLLHTTYGIRLKWEPGSPNEVVWGEGRITSENNCLSLTRKGVTLSLEQPQLFEWHRWVDCFSPHARVVWRSHFHSLLLKSLWYALTHEDTIKNLKSLMWGIGYKRYPTKWFIPMLKRFHQQYKLSRVVSLPILLGWVKEGKRRAEELSTMEPPNYEGGACS